MEDVPIDPTTDRSFTRVSLGISAVLVGVLMIMLDTTIVNLAIPRIQREFHANVASMQWVVNAYNLAIATLLISAGALSDRIGPRRAVWWGLVVFTIGSLGCGLTETVPVLIGVRVVQGIGAALVMSAGLALVSALHPGAQERANAFALWGAVVGIGTVLGPTAGGVLVDSLGWRSVFLLNVPIGAVAIVLLQLTTKSEPAAYRRPFDSFGQVLVIVTFGAMAVGMSLIGEQAWGSVMLISALSVILVAGTALVLTERRARHPIVPPQLLRSRTFLAPVLAGGILSFGVYGLLFAFSLYLQQGRGYDATHAGLALIPFAGVTTAASPFAGRMIIRFGSHRVLLVAQLVATLGTLILVIAVVTNTYWAAALGLCLLGAYHAAAQPTINAAAMQTTAEAYAGIGGGLLSTVRQTGSVLGIALLAGLLSSASNIVIGTERALAALLITFAISAATVAWIGAGQPSRK